MGLGDMLGGGNAEQQEGSDKKHGDQQGGLKDKANDFVDDQQEQHSDKLGGASDKANEFIDDKQGDGNTQG